MSTGKNTKGYETPNHPYQGERIAEESDLLTVRSEEQRGVLARSVRAA